MNQNDQEFLVQKIRSQYTEKQLTELDELRALDTRVKRPANIFAYVFGVIGVLVMGCGMSLVMTDVGALVGLQDALIPGVAIGLVGLVMVLVNYPIYNAILSSRKKKFAEKIIALSEKLLEQ